MKTSVSPSTTRNWNVDVLFHCPLQGRTRNGRRHFHQLFRQLRRTEDCASSAEWTDKLGHFDNLLSNKIQRVEESEDVHQLFHHLRHNLNHGHDIGKLLRGVLPGPVPVAPAAHPDKVAGNPGEEGASVAVAPRTCPCASPPRPCPSSVLLRSGAKTRTGPSRRSAARASATSAGVFPSDGGRALTVVASSYCSPLGRGNQFGQNVDLWW